MPLETEQERNERERREHQQRYGDFAWGLPDAHGDEMDEDAPDSDEAQDELGATA